MSKTGNKFNIWIAYSDLFSNLSTFALISVVGILAIMGSGSLVARKVAGVHQCAFAGSIQSKIAKGDTILHSYDVAPALQDRSNECSEYFSIDHYKFRGPVADISYFQNETGARIKPAQLQMICAPVWRVLTNKKFYDIGGHISFIGVSGLSTTGPNNNQCHQSETFELSGNGFPNSISEEETIRRCEMNINAYNSSNVDCHAILKCMNYKYGVRSDWCQRVMRAKLSDSLAKLNCRKGPAEDQARVIYQICQSAPFDRAFQTQIFDGDEAVDFAHRADGLLELWRQRVSFEGTAQDASSGQYPANPVLADATRNQPDGEILMEFRYAK